MLQLLDVSIVNTVNFILKYKAILNFTCATLGFATPKYFCLVSETSGTTSAKWEEIYDLVVVLVPLAGKTGLVAKAVDF